MSQSQEKNRESAIEAAVASLVQQYGTNTHDRLSLFDRIEVHVENLRQREDQEAVDARRRKSAELKKPVRVYLDGCFDIMHSGHYNALRQAKSLGDILVVGIHSDEEIERNKGPTTMNDDERRGAVEACKWVDEVHFGAPYSPSVALLDQLNCDFCVHGDDMPVAANGTSAYEETIKAGRCKVIKRTEGVSTTDIVGRMLLMTRDHHLPGPSRSELASIATEDEKDKKPAYVTRALTAFLPTTQRILQFSNFADGQRSLSDRPPSKVVYLAGSFDLFHVSHTEILEAAKKLGDFLLVGVHSDRTVNEHRGKNYPIMNLHERVLNVLSCKFVDEVILGAPWEISKDMLTTMNIKIVAHGANNIDYNAEEIKSDPYVLPKELGIFQEIKIERNLTTDSIIQRIISNRQRYEKRNEKKTASEAEYFSRQKVYIPEL